MRQKSPTLTYEHMKLCDEIKCLRQQNQNLKKRLQKMQDAMHLVYISKKKYKMKFKEVKQKLDILQTVYKKNTQQNACIHLGQYYDEFELNKFGSKEDNKKFQRVNQGNQKSKQNTKLSQSGLKQDLTSNTLQTVPSLRKSNSKQHSENWFFRTKRSNNNNQSSVKRKSLTKDVGKIFKFKNTNKNTNYHSSGSQFENQLLTNHQQRQNISSQKRLQYINRKQTFVGNQGEAKNHQKNEGRSLKQMIQNLISQLKSFDMSKKTYINERNSQKQKNSHLFLSQSNLYEKLQQVSSKLNQIQFNQQKLMLRISENQQKSIQNTKVLGSKNQNSINQMNSSFLKAIQDIGKDLSDWKIDYGYVVK